MNGLRLSLVRVGGAVTGITIHRYDRHLVTHAADRLGLLPGFAEGTDLTPEEAVWAMIEGSRLTLAAYAPPPSRDAWWIASGIAIALVVAFVAGLAWLTWERPPCSTELGFWTGCTR